MNKAEADALFKECEEKLHEAMASVTRRDNPRATTQILNAMSILLRLSEAWPMDEKRKQVADTSA